MPTNLLVPGMDPAPWATSLTPGGSGAPAREPGLALGRSGLDPGFFLGDDAQQDRVGLELPDPASALDARSGPARGGRLGLREAFLESPFGQEVLLLAVEVLSPSIDSSGRLHVSILGHGDFTLPRREPDPFAEDMERVMAMPLGPSGDLAWTPTGLTLAPVTRSAALDGPLTIREFAALLVGELVDFLTHPVTLLLAVMGGTGYIVLRLALERSALRAHRHGRHSSHRHHRPHRSGHRSRRTPGGLPHQR